APLPGGDFSPSDRDRVARDLAAAVPFLDTGTAERLARTYGTMARGILAGAACLEELGEHFGAGLYECELQHLVDKEWARTAEDVLWRRTKLGLRLADGQRRRLEEWLGSHRPAGVAFYR
ncbi:MAG: glycerol-3-phosphate dehydrogenase, partial [Hyphomicrobiaceae bacterium]|nr:glycerol-3-phosphate dehydrogenase [Hyphomicrobiaceae bacterium]